MGSSNTKPQEKVELTTDIQTVTDVAIRNKPELTAWITNIKQLLETKTARVQEQNDAAIAIATTTTKSKTNTNTNTTKRPPTTTPLPTTIDDGVRTLSIQYSLAPKDANEIKRTIAMTTKLKRLIVRNHFGGPGIGYREEIASRVLLAMGKWCGESQSVVSFDLQGNNMGGSTKGSDKRTGDALCPVYDIRKVGPNGSYILQGLADSKLKRYNDSADANANKKNTHKTAVMERIVLKHNNLTHYGYYYRPVGASLRSLLSNKGRILTLDLSHCVLGVDAVAKGFSNGLYGIEKLNLSHNQLGGRWKFDRRGDSFEASLLFVKELKKILQTTNSQRPLKSIDLSSNRFNTTHCQCIGEGLMGNCFLKHINLAHNSNMKDEGIEEIINSQYSTVSVLEMLDLRETGLSSMALFFLKKLHAKLDPPTTTTTRAVVVNDPDVAVNPMNSPTVRKLVIDISVNSIDTHAIDALPESHGDSKIRFITNSWRHLVQGRVNVASLSQVQNYAIDFVLKGSKFERKYNKRGRLGLQLIASSACPEVCEQLASAVVSATIKGSPSQPTTKGGTRIAVGSLLTHINGVSTSGMTLAQTIERLKSVRQSKHLQKRKEAWLEKEEKTDTKNKKEKRQKKIPKNARQELKELEEQKETEEDEGTLADPYEKYIVLRFVGRLSKGPPRLKRRKPGSRKEAKRQQELAQKLQQQELENAVAARLQHEKDQHFINGTSSSSSSSSSSSTLPVCTLEKRPATTVAVATDELLDGWVETMDDGGSTYYWNMETNATDWERPIKYIQQDIGGGGGGDGGGEQKGSKRHSLFDLSKVDGVKTEDELALEEMLKEQEDEERANLIFRKIKAESSASQHHGITKKSRGTRQSQTNWRTNVEN